MKILINAISIGGGGGLTVLTKLLEAFISFSDDIIWYITAEPQVLSRIPKSKRIIGIPYAWAKKSPLHHMFWYEVTLPKLIRNLCIDVCFSQTNFLPRCKLSCPSLLLIQQAGYFSEDFRNLFFSWSKSRLHKFIWMQKERWAYLSIQKATIVTVQTQALARRISESLKVSKDKIAIIPHGPGIINPALYNVRSLPNDSNETIRIGYVTKWGVQKDFDTVIHAIKLLKDQGMRVKLLLTLDEDEGNSFPMLNHIRSLIQKYDIDDMVENLGNLTDLTKIRELYVSLNLFVFPSLCESFGFPLVEAMASSLPVIVVDTESNLEIVGKAGLTFPAKNAKTLAEKITYLIKNKDFYKRSSKNSIDRSLDFSWNQAAMNLITLINKIKAKCSNDS